MQMSFLGREWLKRLEGLSLTAYPDGGGYSIGYGHHGAQKGQVISLAEAEALFDADVKKHEAAVTRALTRGATQPQFDALVSFSYNVGESQKGMAGSTVVREHNAGNRAAAAAAFDLWNKSQGKVLAVLVKRRNLEQQLYETGVYSTSLDDKGKAAVAAAARAPQLSPWVAAVAVAAAAYVLLPRVAPRRFPRAA